MSGRRTKEQIENEKEYGKLLPAIYCQIPEEPCDYTVEPTKAKLWARSAWWTGKYSAVELAEHINAPLRTLQNWIRGTRYHTGWAEDKDKADARAISRAVASNTIRMDKLLTQLISALEKSASMILDENRHLTVDEFNKLTNAFEKIFKLRQLELGRPTEIFAGEDGKLPTWSEIRAKIEAVEVPAYEVIE